MGVRKCRHCGFEPVAYDARRCPNCGEKVSNLGVVFRYAGKGAVIGFLLGAVFALVSTVFGMIWAFMELGRPHAAKLAEGISHALVITLLDALAGLLIGFLAGIVVGLGAWMAGKQ